jgi:hypothetical protein
MDWIVGKIVGFGVPGLVLLIAMGLSGGVGAAAFTAGLAAIGGSRKTLSKEAPRNPSHRFGQSRNPHVLFG